MSRVKLETINEELGKYKVFDPRGNTTKSFNIKDISNIEKWIEEAGYSPELGMEYCTKADMSLIFPCRYEQN